jgi:hypothetical protein
VIITAWSPTSQLRCTATDGVLGTHNIDGAANIITAAICALTNNQPATECTPTVQALEKQSRTDNPAYAVPAACRQTT